jgi:hypothetical protein
MSLQLDRKVAEAKFRMTDGEIVTITRNAEGKPSHYVDFFDNRTKKGGGGGTSMAASAADDEW